MGRHSHISDMIKGIYYADKSVLDTIQHLPPSTDVVPITTLYGKVNGTFTKIGYSCGLCGRMWQKESLNVRHPYICRKLKKLKVSKQT